MPAYYFGKPVRYHVGVIGLKRNQRGRANGEVTIEIELWDVLGKSGGGIRNNTERTDTGHETEGVQRRLAAARVIQMGRGPEEGRARLVDGARSDGFCITNDKLLCASGRYRGEARHACAAVGQ